MGLLLNLAANKTFVFLGLGRCGDQVHIYWGIVAIGTDRKSLLFGPSTDPTKTNNPSFGRVHPTTILVLLCLGRLRKPTNNKKILRADADKDKPLLLARNKHDVLYSAGPTQINMFVL